MSGKSIEIKAMTKEEAVKRALKIFEVKEEDVHVEVTELKKSKSSLFGLFTKEGLYSVEIKKREKQAIKPDAPDKKAPFQKPAKKEFRKDERKEERKEEKKFARSEDGKAQRSERDRKEREKKEKTGTVATTAAGKGEDSSLHDKAAFFEAFHDAEEDFADSMGESAVYEDISEALQTKTQTILEKMGLALSTKITKISERNYLVELYGEDNGIIIGKKGKTLNNFEYLLKSIFKKYRIEVDVEGFKEKRYETLKKLSKKMAEKVLKTGKTVKLNSMPAKERKIIHEVMNKYPQLDTFSEGREPNRFIIIKKKR